MKSKEVMELPVYELMTHYVEMVKPDMSVFDAMVRMFEKKARCLILVKQHPYKEIGMVTRFDILDRVVGEGKNPLHITLSEIYSKKLFYIDHDSTVKEAARIMGEENLCVMPVKKGKDIVGVISSTDIFKAFKDFCIC